MVSSDHGCAAGTEVARGFRRRGARLEILEAATPAHGTMGRAPAVSTGVIPVRGLSNLPLQRTKAVSPWPTANEPRPRGSF